MLNQPSPKKIIIGWERMQYLKYEIFFLTIKESFTSNCKTQLMERDPISPFGASHVLHFVLATRYCKVPLYSLSTGIYL